MRCTGQQLVETPPLLGFFGKSEAYEGGGGFSSFPENRICAYRPDRPGGTLKKRKIRFFGFLPNFALFFSVRAFGARLFPFSFYFLPWRASGAPFFPIFVLGAPAARLFLPHFSFGFS